MNWNALSDDELVARYQAGEETALKNLILRYERRLFSYLIVSVKNKEVAEDIFQDTFIKVINTIRSGNYHEEGKFFQWIMRIANNLKIDYYRRLQRMPTVDGGEEFDIFTIIGSRDESIEEKMIREQTYADLNHYVEYLPEEQKEVLKMRIYSDYSFKEIAEMTNVSINTALGRMRYALINLRKIMAKHQVAL
ncbi:MAG: sigma-70 family RNA polymerase sigma factor [Bacteroidales bacterium]|jgi:RNA polymerase sigma-70 factor (ECF subfamily)|nr:sigma-70 family RNA polymerase sigma factor [Bacteroidales bacterium]MBR4637711.1 sigma-70 family RNA polymerase sigma factor [Bacteroidales bacterium]MBR5919738.1 sigma-70 family RNA polymerase sigma factor [Bacteroidales bacterium]MBR6175497.1 sigma-70 family RNA polymerase sigma factor [Bacteroidales bacterium]MBR6904460.1 sigma-70 family RNA polymerase sigma factor [Bacteroidales bacterium]